MAMLRVLAVALLGAILTVGLIGCDEGAASDETAARSREYDAYLKYREAVYKGQPAPTAPAPAAPAPGAPAPTAPAPAPTAPDAEPVSPGTGSPTP